MNRRSLLLLFVIPLLAMSYAVAHAADDAADDADDAPRQNLDVLYELAEGFAHDQAVDFDAERIEVKASSLDRRLRLAECTQGIEAFQPSGSSFPGRATVGLRCEGPSHWTVYVSVDMKVYVPVVTARDYLRKGELVGADDIELAAVDIGSLTSGYYTEPAEVVGMQVSSGIKPGIALKPSQLRKRTLVHRGDRVSILIATGGLQVSSQGEARADGAKGDRIVVRNLRSKKEVEGVVIDAGVVEVAL